MPIEGSTSSEVDATCKIRYESVTSFLSYFGRTGEIVQCGLEGRKGTHREEFLKTADRNKDLSKRSVRKGKLERDRR